MNYFINASTHNNQDEVVYSNSSSQDRLLSPFEVFMIHSFTTSWEKGENSRGWRRSRGTTISTTRTTFHHCYPPPLELWQSKRWWEESGEEEPQKLSYTLIHVHSLRNLSFIEGITSLKVNNLAVEGNNFNAGVVYLVSVIRVISWLLNNLFMCLFIYNITVLIY